ncbi:DUF6804 family protein [Aequorivita sp. CIP111184]|uniref:DUF6804 family protein n=1 Tax=Aequorivita sp. CIP111184 TaxID=2211356 RepID=UPI000DD0E464|nr:DUF6804 family protein [Aequorivita sp. CIP111184]
MTKLIKIALAILFFLCLLNMPYGYYQLVRFLAFIGFGYIAYQANQENNNTAKIIYAALALLFQPFVKIALGRELWNIVDVLVAIGLLISIFQKRKTTMEKPNSRK